MAKRNVFNNFYNKYELNFYYFLSIQIIISFRSKIMIQFHEFWIEGLLKNLRFCPKKSQHGFSYWHHSRILQWKLWRIFYNCHGVIDRFNWCCLLDFTSKRIIQTLHRVVTSFATRTQAVTEPYPHWSLTQFLLLDQPSLMALILWNFFKNVTKR